MLAAATPPTIWQSLLTDWAGLARSMRSQHRRPEQANGAALEGVIRQRRRHVDRLVELALLAAD